jgi:hypothetical protein
MSCATPLLTALQNRQFQQAVELLHTYEQEHSQKTFFNVLCVSAVRVLFEFYEFDDSRDVWYVIVQPTLTMQQVLV